MFGIGAGEFILIMIVGLIVFGPSKLPEIGRSLGKMIHEFRKAQAALTATISEVDDTPSKPAAAQTTSATSSNSTTSITPATQTTSSASTKVDTQKAESTVKTQTIEEVTEMINAKPISVPESNVNVSKETEIK